MQPTFTQNPITPIQKFSTIQKFSLTVIYSAEGPEVRDQGVSANSNVAHASFGHNKIKMKSKEFAQPAHCQIPTTTYGGTHELWEAVHRVTKNNFFDTERKNGVAFLWNTTRNDEIVVQVSSFQVLQFFLLQRQFFQVQFRSNLGSFLL